MCVPLTSTQSPKTFIVTYRYFDLVLRAQKGADNWTSGFPQFMSYGRTELEALDLHRTSVGVADVISKDTFAGNTLKRSF